MNQYNGAYKFQSELEKRFSDQMSVIRRTTELINHMGGLLSVRHEKDKFLETALQFARIAVETPESIVSILRSGHIAQAHVLLRWFLELAHLCYYLWQNPSEHVKWINGEQIRPGKIGKFLEKVEFNSWHSTYEDRSNLVHGNSVFVDHYHVIAKRTPNSEGQLLLIGSALTNVMWITHKLNYVFGKVLQPFIGDVYGTLVQRYNELQDIIMKMTEEQVRSEKLLISHYDDKQTSSE